MRPSFTIGTLALLIGGAAFADTTTPELMITTTDSHGNVVYAVGGGSSETQTLTTINGTAGDVNYATASGFNFEGWTIEYFDGTSDGSSNQSPDLQLTSITANCNGLCNNLTVWLSATGFTTQVTGLTTTYSGTLGANAGNTTQTSWADPGNVNFGNTTTPLATFNSNTMGAGAFGSPGFSKTTADNLGGPGASYSLTIEQTFTGCQNCQYSVTGEIANGSGNVGGDDPVPEPASIAPEGGALMLLTGGFLWVMRRLRSVARQS